MWCVRDKLFQYLKWINNLYFLSFCSFEECLESWKWWRHIFHIYIYILKWLQSEIGWWMCSKWIEPNHLKFIALSVDLYRSFEVKLAFYWTKPERNLLTRNKFKKKKKSNQFNKRIHHQRIYNDVEKWHRFFSLFLDILISMALYVYPIWRFNKIQDWHGLAIHFGWRRKNGLSAFKLSASTEYIVRDIHNVPPKLNANTLTRTNLVQRVCCSFEWACETSSKRCFRDFETTATTMKQRAGERMPKQT